jgi:hypothetical protein
MSIVTRCTLLLVAIKDVDVDADVLAYLNPSRSTTSAPVYSRNLLCSFDRRKWKTTDHARWRWTSSTTSGLDGYLSVS